MKKWLIAGAVCLLAGVLMCVGALSTVGWKLSALSTDPAYEKKTQAFSAQNTHHDQTHGSFSMPQRICIADDTVDITVGPSPDDEIHAVYFENDYERYEVTQGDVLRFEKKRLNRPWSEGFVQLSFTQVTFELLVPEDYTGSIEIESDTGTISVSGIYADVLTVETDTGNVILEDLTISGRLEAEADTGDISADRVEAADFEAETETGSVTLKDIQTERVFVQTDTGTILLDRVDARAVFAQTETGAISGVLAGAKADYSISIEKEVWADCNLENRQGGVRSLSVDTETGAIDIIFEK